MSEVAKMLGDALASVREQVQAVLPGLSGVKMAEDIGHTIGQKAIQGSAELSQGLNAQSNAYVPYGAGQQSPSSHEHARGR